MLDSLSKSPADVDVRQPADRGERVPAKEPDKGTRPATDDLRQDGVGSIPQPSGEGEGVRGGIRTGVQRGDTEGRPGIQREPAETAVAEGSGRGVAETRPAGAGEGKAPRSQEDDDLNHVLLIESEELHGTRQPSKSPPRVDVREPARAGEGVVQRIDCRTAINFKNGQLESRLEAKLQQALNLVVKLKDERGLNEEDAFSDKAFLLLFLVGTGVP
jgi:hypothetical protein